MVRIGICQQCNAMQCIQRMIANGMVAGGAIRAAIRDAMCVCVCVGVVLATDDGRARLRPQSVCTRWDFEVKHGIWVHVLQRNAIIWMQPYAHAERFQRTVQCKVQKRSCDCPGHRKSRR